MIAHTFDPSILEAEAGEPVCVWGQPDRHKLQDSHSCIIERDSKNTQIEDIAKAQRIKNNWIPIEL